MLFTSYVNDISSFKSNFPGTFKDFTLMDYGFTEGRQPASGLWGPILLAAALYAAV